MNLKNIDSERVNYKNKERQFLIFLGLTLIMTWVFYFESTQGRNESFVTLLMVLASVLAIVFCVAFFRKIFGKNQALSKNNTHLNYNEKIIVSGDVKYFKKNKSINGQLILTTKRLVFEPHDSVGVYIQYYWLENIDWVKTYKVLGLFKTGLTIASYGNLELFLSHYPEDWHQVIIEQIKVVKNATRDTY